MWWYTKHQLYALFYKRKPETAGSTHTYITVGHEVDVHVARRQQDVDDEASQLGPGDGFGRREQRDG